ncbi:hypothetical protein TRFO_33867 [Tritrichomonas foetus]|uniref:Uncharacterized protein n=1 Tax=Tritrichomonas foetus TaxID=1144522 RepID=A0A1J4JLR6_9EUKA|nr:hypothetical protein TRFO_33867 [Tritrichomonas foetus]|eukprot:OHS99633.1 hypothetical protein TRFO_33867 [Tritrichomonas foetus]
MAFAPWAIIAEFSFLLFLFTMPLCDCCSNPYGLQKGEHTKNGEKPLSNFQLLVLFVQNIFQFKGLATGILDLFRTFQSYGMTFYIASKVSEESSETELPEFLQGTKFYDWFMWANTLINTIVNKFSQMRKLTDFEGLFLGSLIFPFLCSIIFIGFTHTASFIFILLLLMLSCGLIGALINMTLFSHYDFIAIIVAMQIAAMIACVYFITLIRRYNGESLKCSQKFIYFICGVLGFPGSIFIIYFFTFIDNEESPQMFGTEESKTGCSAGCTRFGTILWAIIFILIYTLGTNILGFDFLQARGFEFDLFLEFILACLLALLFVAYLIFEIYVCVKSLKNPLTINHLMTTICVIYLFIARLNMLPSIEDFFANDIFTVYRDGSSNKIYPFGGLYFFVWIFNVAFPYLFVIIFSYIGYFYRCHSIPYVYRLFLTNITSVTSRICSNYKNKFSMWAIIEDFAIIVYAISAGKGYIECCLLINSIMLVLDLVFKPHVFMSSTIIDAGSRLVRLIGDALALRVMKGGEMYADWVGIILIIIACLPLIAGFIYFCLQEWTLKKRLKIIENSLIIDIGQDKLKGKLRDEEVPIDDDDIDYLLNRAKEGGRINVDEDEPDGQKGGDNEKFKFDDLDKISQLQQPVLPPPDPINNISDFSLDDFDNNDDDSEAPTFRDPDLINPPNDASAEKKRDDEEQISLKSHKSRNSQRKSISKSTAKIEGSQMFDRLLAIHVDKPKNAIYEVELPPPLEIVQPRPEETYTLEGGRALSQEQRFQQVVQMANKLNYKYAETNDCSVHFSVHLIRDFKSTRDAKKLQKENDAIARFVASILFAGIFLFGAFIITHIMSLYFIDTTYIHIHPSGAQTILGDPYWELSV